ncbi:MAG: lysylphosphatidylglycerol synthase transmembrane domain-containing protein [Bacteroidota bacterium]|nr:lysylphosphatidylglycerol synthase transmembrane domain-containing protein [Bacteroidota bacterium]
MVKRINKSINKSKALKQNIVKTFKFLSFLSLGIFIFWMVYKDQDMSRLKSILTNEVNYFWIVVSLFIGLLSHISRSIRWNLMIEPLSHKPGMLNTLLAVMIGYLMNLALPRMGEISRCGVLARYEKIPFTKLIGTVVLERLIDMLMLLLLLLIVVFTQFGQVLEFLNNNPDVNQKIKKVMYSPVLIGGLVFILVIVWFLRHQILRSSFMKRMMSYVHQFVEGFRSILKMKKVGAFIFHSFFIWFLYYIMLYCIFFSFGFTSHLPALAALTVFVLGSFGMVAPVQGGIGAWHFMVIEGLALYGVDQADGQVFALVAHGSMTILLIVLGLISLLVLPFVNERNITS